VSQSHSDSTQPLDPNAAPAWAENATNRQAYLRGFVVAGTAPGLSLFASSLGYGALARDLGFTWGHAVYLSATLYALPAQVLLIDQLARGATLAAIAFAVTLSAIRLLPMTVAMTPYLGERRTLRPIHFLAVHCIAVTLWIEGSRRLPQLPQRLRLAHLIGLGTGTILCTIAGTLIGFFAAGSLPPALAAALLFVTPIYFLLSMMLTARGASDWMAIAGGAILGPCLYIMAPGPDLVLTGLIGGTLAWALGRRARA
jgi:predicted branched-subunit amino acid permease